MADYDGIYQISDNLQTFNISATSFYPGGNYPVVPVSPNSGNYHGVDIDTATIVSIASSCIILISGCIAVVCLIMYMKKTDMLYRSRTCAKCGAHVAREEPGNLRTPVRSDCQSAQPSVSKPTPNRLANYQFAVKSQPNLATEMDSIVIYKGLTASQGKLPFSSATDRSLTANFNNASNSADFIEINKSGGHKENNFFDEDDDAAPYATFNLAGFETDSKVSDTYETFAAKFSEPPYMLLKKGLECPAPPQYADSVDYKMSMIENKSCKMLEDIYQSTNASQYHSIASCSSNQEELVRAYEFGKQQKLKLQKLQDQFIECLQRNDNDETVYRSLSSDHESPTDPGIREFTKSPPKPNEKRQGIVFHHQPSAAELIEISKHGPLENQEANDEHMTPTTIDSQNESQVCRVVDEDKNDLSSNETTNSFSSISGGSSSHETTPSAGSESANDEDSSSTATPDHYPAPKDGRQLNFGALPRDRSRNPSWASCTTMKSNNVLGPQYLGSERSSEHSRLAALKGLSSDDDELSGHQDKPIAFSQELIEEIYGYSKTRFGSDSAAPEPTTQYGGSRYQMGETKQAIITPVSKWSSTSVGNEAPSSRVDAYKSGAKKTLTAEIASQRNPLL